MKKFFISIIIAIIALITPVFALDSVVEISVDPEFSVYGLGDNAEDFAEGIKMDEDDFNLFCQRNNIIYLAVNEDNSKQIRVSAKQSKFSTELGDLSKLSDSKITELIPDIIGDESIKGEIVKKDDLKFIKTAISTSDSGGQYSIIHYRTVAYGDDYTLSFYTSVHSDSDYIEEAFKSFVIAENKTNSVFTVIIIIAIVGLAIVAVYIIYTFIRDSKYKKDLSENEYIELP